MGTGVDGRRESSGCARPVCACVMIASLFFFVLPSLFSSPFLPFLSLVPSFVQSSPLASSVLRSFVRHYLSFVYV